MLLSDHYKNYRGPELISAILGGENITAKATQLYGENNNWHGCLWTYKEAFGDKCENKNYRFDFKGKDGKEVTLLVSGKAAKAIKHGRICKPNSSVEVTITGMIKEGTITAAKLTEKKK